MGEVLTPKRQTVVERLRRRLDHYRKHHNSCLPRYELSADALTEKQRQDTHLLKHRYVESKAKKAKTGKNSNSNEHHKHALKDAISDMQKVAHPKPVKRHLENSPVVVSTASDGPTDEQERSAKIPKSSISDSNPYTESQQRHNKKLAAPTLLVQQKLFPNNTVNNTRPLSSNGVQLLDNCTGSAAETAKEPASLSHSETIVTHPVIQNQPDKSSTTKHIDETNTDCSLVSNSVECKQEKDPKSAPVLCQFQDNNLDYHEDLQQQQQDRLSDTFPSISGFTEDSNDDMIHPDILKDLIDDVFTNSADIMKDFVDFDENVGSVKVSDANDAINKSDILIKSSSSFRTPANGLAFAVNPQAGNQQSTGLFDSSLIIVTAAMSPSAKCSTVASSNSTKSCIPSHQQSLSAFGVSSTTSHQLPDNLSLDFKLTEPSPAALTLKQMAEQHQNMEQKQQLRSLEPANRLGFNVDSFSDPLSFSFRNGLPMSENYIISKHSNTSSGFFNSARFNSVSTIPGLETNTFKRDSYQDRRLPNQQGQLIMPNTGNSESKSTYNKSIPSGWSVDVINNSSASAHSVGSRYVATTGRAQVNENQALNIGYDNQNVQQVQTTNSGTKQSDVMTHLSYTGVCNQYNPQQMNSISNSVFPAPMTQGIYYNQQFSPTIESLPPEYKLNQSNVMSLIEQTPLPTSGYQQTYVDHQQTHNRNTSNQWRHVHPSQINLNHERYQHHDDYGELSSNDQIVSNTAHQNIHCIPYRTVSAYGQASQSNSNSHNNQTIMQHREQINTQFQEKQHLQHRLVNPLNIQNLGTEAVSSVNTTNTHVYQIAPDGTQITLDFFDNIESNASDLLNFDQVLQSDATTPFQLLDDMEMLNKRL